MKLKVPNLRELNLGRLGRSRGKTGSSLLGLAFDDGRLEGVWLCRTNGHFEVRKTFSVPLSLDLLTNEVELVGREIRKHLNEAGIRERRCAVCVPLAWALTLQVQVPPLPEEDLQSFLQMESERGFPYGPDDLMTCHSLCQTPGGERSAMLVAIPRGHLSRLEAVLAAAQLKVVSFSLGTVALDGAGREPGGIVTLVPGASNINLQVTTGGGIAALRIVAGASERQGSESPSAIEQVARDLRITLGQLHPDLRSQIRRVRIYGRTEAAARLSDTLRTQAEAMGLQVQSVRDYGTADFGVTLPAGTPVSPALSLAARHLTGNPAGFEFLPPKVTRWQQLSSRYSSKKLVWAGVIAGAAALLVVLAFSVQQVLLVYWGSKWKAMEPKVKELDSMQQLNRRYSPWFDESVRSLGILRRLTEAFPEDGTVSVRNIEIREPSKVTCTGTARDGQALLRTLDKLRTAKEISDVKVDTMRGRSPMEFTFNFVWAGQTGP